MAIALMCNIVLAFVSCMMWTMSLLHTQANPNWTYSCRYLLVYCQMLFTFMLCAISVGLLVAVLIKFQDPGRATKTILTFAIMMLAEVPGMYLLGKLIRAELPLELYHSPLWWQLYTCPMPMFTRKGRERLKTSAVHRAEQMKAQAKANVQQKFDSECEKEENNSLHNLLQQAAISIGRGDIDVSIYASRLEEELYDDAEQLIGEDVTMLERYMTRRLAKEVTILLQSADHSIS